MGNIPEKDRQFIENQINKAKTKAEIGMKNEYFFLKNTYRHPEKNLPQINNSKGNSENNKVIVNPIRIKKRFERYAKWFRMMFSREMDGPKSENNIKYNPSHQKIKSSATYTPGMNLKGSAFNYEYLLTNYYRLNTNHFLLRVQKGPPDSLRYLSWGIISNIPLEKDENLLKYYSSLPIDDETDIQIKKDLNRTFTDNDLEIETKIYSNTGEEINPEESLYKLLKALSNVDKNMSYCQGINFVAGFLLKVSDFDETWTFYMLISLFSNTFTKGINLRGFFIEGFPLLNGLMYAFDTLLKSEHPDLFNKIEEFGLPKEAWITKWCHCLYSVFLPYELSLRLWDYILSIDISFIVSFSLTLMDYTEKDIYNLPDTVDFIQYFKNLFSKEEVKYNGLDYQSNKRHLIMDDLLEDALKKHQNYSEKDIYSSLVREYFKQQKIIFNDQVEYEMMINEEEIKGPRRNLTQGFEGMNIPTEDSTDHLKMGSEEIDIKYGLSDLNNRNNKIYDSSGERIDYRDFEFNSIEDELSDKNEGIDKPNSFNFYLRGSNLKNK
ncbi:MAG: TBC domain-containing protein [archaeon]|nr:TBC domain-containing protein [archaeon]